jgi:hypothetical protein
LARANARAPGVNEKTFAAIEAWGLKEWLAGLREELVSKAYQPDPVRRVTIPNPVAASDRLAFRPSGIGWCAAKLVFEPIFETVFEDSAYGYRPVRGAVDAVKEVHRLICRGYSDVVDADLFRAARTRFRRPGSQVCPRAAAGQRHPPRHNRQLATHTSGLLLPQDHPPWPEQGYALPEFIRTLKEGATGGRLTIGKVDRGLMIAALPKSRAKPGIGISSLAKGLQK